MWRECEKEVKMVQGNEVESSVWAADQRQRDAVSRGAGRHVISTLELNLARFISTSVYFFQ